VLNRRWFSPPAFSLYPNPLKRFGLPSLVRPINNPVWNPA